MKKIVVLGGTGNIGRWVVRDLYDFCKDCEILIVSNDRKAIQYAKSFKSSRVKGAVVDVTDVGNTAKLLKGAAVCVNCVVYYFNLDVMRACLKANVNYLDLGGLFHVTRKQLKLNKQFKKKKLIAVLGCGSTPGITNVMAKYGARMLDKVDEIHISFGDADFTKYEQPFVLPYTMYTLFDEFMMKPALFTKGRLKLVEPQSGNVEIIFPKPVGKLKGFYTIHSELATFPSSFKLKECSFRVTFPSEFDEKIRFLIDTGFASDKEILVKGMKVKPRDLTAKVMDRWLPKAGTRINDLEYLRLEFKGRKKGKKKKFILYCLTKSNKKYNVPAGVYDTAVPPSIIAQMIANGKVKERGAVAPEKCVDYKVFFKELRRRGISVFKRSK